MANAEEVARQLLDRCEVRRHPVPVERIARELEAELAFEPLDGDVSGMLYREGDRAVIGINSSHPKVRQRFSIAHEIGHLVLHKGRPMIIDRSVRVNKRDENAALGTNTEEIEANRFAAALLMPEMMLRSVLAQLSASTTDPEALVRSLADRFQVSTQAMEYRLLNLGLSAPR